MSYTNTFLFLMLLVVGTSCVTNKKFVLLQKDDLHNKNLSKDSVVRSYQPATFEYKLQPEDIVYVT
ncbi:MAG TPA: polysaccharide export protein, partial [Cyclobacteriaceae bacterium]|nr:polysaccharide export protein [Cyclobacteriaceae bacterium]